MKYSYKISIIVPVYNTERYLEECLKSLVSQTMNRKEMEILLINDGSTDSSGEICKSWQSKYSNIVYYDKENEGVSATRNLGIQKAMGKYILFLDPDDYLSKNAIRDIVTFFDMHYDEIDMVTYPMVLVYPSGRKKMHSRYKNAFSRYDNIYDLNENYHLVQATINVCIKNNKKLLFDINQFYSEDEQFNTKILMEKKKLGYVCNAYYYYRQHSNSVTAKKNRLDLEKIYTFHEQFQRQYHNHPYIQSIIINNLRWRIEQECLCPESLSIEERNAYLKTVTNRLKKIDFSLFHEELESSLLLELAALSDQKFFTEVADDGTYSLYSNEKKLLENMKSENEIYYLLWKNDRIRIDGRIVTGLYHDKNVEAYATIYFIDNRQEKKKLNLKNDLVYKDKVSKMYQLEVNPREITKITFSLVANQKEVLLFTKSTEWCSKWKAIGPYQMIIRDKILVKKKRFYTNMINKFRGCGKIQLLIINFLAFFSKEGKNCVLYFGDKNSKIYDLYLKEERKKMFVSNGMGLKYKIKILNCDTLITDKSIRFVLPFGKMRKYYVQSSKCRVIKNEK